MNYTEYERLMNDDGPDGIAFRRRILEAHADKPTAATATATKTRMHGRDAAPAQGQLYKEMRKAFREAHANYQGETLKFALQQLQVKYRHELATLQAAYLEAKREIDAKAASRKVQATPEATAAVRRYLDQGISPGDLARMLADRGERAALAALRDELGFYAQANKLDRHAEQNLSDIVGHHESRLWDASERAAHEEAVGWQQVGIPYLEFNHTNISQWLDRQLLSNAHNESLPGPGIYHWNADKDGPKGLQVLDTPNE